MKIAVSPQFLLKLLQFGLAGTSSSLLLLLAGIAVAPTDRPAAPEPAILCQSDAGPCSDALTHHSFRYGVRVRAIVRPSDKNDHYQCASNRSLPRPVFFCRFDLLLISAAVSRRSDCAATAAGCALLTRALPVRAGPSV